MLRNKTCLSCEREYCDKHENVGFYDNDDNSLCKYCVFADHFDHLSDEDAPNTTSSFECDPDTTDSGSDLSSSYSSEEEL
jgi:hypothetical protein